MLLSYHYPPLHCRMQDPLLRLVERIAPTRSLVYLYVDLLLMLISPRAKLISRPLADNFS